MKSLTMIMVLIISATVFAKAPPTGNGQMQTLNQVAQSSTEVIINRLQSVEMDVVKKYGSDFYKGLNNVHQISGADQLADIADAASEISTKLFAYRSYKADISAQEDQSLQDTQITLDLLANTLRGRAFRQLLNEPVR